MTFIKVLCALAICLVPIVRPASEGSGCEIWGCTTYVDVPTNSADFTIDAPFTQPPGPGSGSCECDGSACVKVTPCEYEGEFIITALGSKTVCSSGSAQANPHKFMLKVSDCGEDDYESITITNNDNCTGVAHYFLAALHCHSCEDWSCP